MLRDKANVCRLGWSFHGILRSDSTRLDRVGDINQGLGGDGG